VTLGVALPSFDRVPLADLDAALAGLPAAAGVAQLLGPEDRNLLIGRPANLRRWTASHLGRGKPPAKGRRPPTDLSPVAAAVAWAATTSPFQQRLAYERLMARHVPLSARRDLPAPAFLHLDPAERFPRISVRRVEQGADGLFGPFRDRRRAEQARDRLHREFPLRPCDYVFEPDPALPLGLGCLFAQVRSCSAPCLGRVAEADYRALAARVAGRLARPGDRGDAGLASFVAAAGGRGIVVATTASHVELYPVRAGRVLDGAAVVAPRGEWEAAAARLRWEDDQEEDPAGTTADWPWLSAWLHSPAGRNSWVALEEPADDAALRAALEPLLGFFK